MCSGEPGEEDAMGKMPESPGELLGEGGGCGLVEQGGRRLVRALWERAPGNSENPEKRTLPDGAEDFVPALGTCPNLPPLNPGSSLLPVSGSLGAFRISPNLTKQLFLVSELSCWRNNNQE